MIGLPSIKRLFSAAILAVGALAFVAGSSVTAQAQRAASPTVDEAELMKPGELPDLVYGDPKAKITIVEYSSMTCPHCATFHREVFPELKKKYIDTGKAKLVFREYPLNFLAYGASMLTRCAGPGKELKLAEVLYSQQRNWAFAGANSVPALFAIAKQAGFTQKTFDACLKDTKLYNKLRKQAARAGKEFGVHSTPHFFVNGKRLGNGNLSDFDKAINALPKS